MATEGSAGAIPSASREAAKLSRQSPANVRIMLDRAICVLEFSAFAYSDISVLWRGDMLFVGTAVDGSMIMCEAASLCPAFMWYHSHTDTARLIPHIACVPRSLTPTYKRLHCLVMVQVSVAMTKHTFPGTRLTPVFWSIDFDAHRRRTLLLHEPSSTPSTPLEDRTYGLSIRSSGPRSECEAGCIE